MTIIKCLLNNSCLISVLLILTSSFADKSFLVAEETKKLSLNDNKLCSPVTTRKLKYESVEVNQGLSRMHPLEWNSAEFCKFHLQSVYSNGGIVAVIQKLNLRKNFTTGECIDYIQFMALSTKHSKSPKFCGYFTARDLMMNANYADDEYLPISFANSFISFNGPLEVEIYISKEPLTLFEQETEFSILFTSFIDCSQPYHRNKNVPFQECDSFKKAYIQICINKKYFDDGNVNCPHYGCIDEGGCFNFLNNNKAENKKLSVGNRVIIGSLSTLAILFAGFILIIWAFKKHKLFCWSEEFANPTVPLENNNRNSRIMEMNEQTGARLAENQAINNLQPSSPTAPNPAEEKDLPPSYESLFPVSAPLR